MASLKILLIDDDKDDQFFFMEAIKETGKIYLCETADDAYKGLQSLEKGYKPDLIFLDLNMPQMNGFDLLEKLKQMEIYRNIPVAIFSTSNNPKDIRRAEELGAVAFLTKPNDLGTLSEKLLRIIQHDFSGQKSIYTE